MSRNLPSSWEAADLGELFEILDSRRVPVNATERASRVGSVPYYGATGQVGWIDDFLFNEELVLLGEDGAPFLEPDEPTAYVIRGQSWVNNHAHVLRALGGTPSAFWKFQFDCTDYHGFVTGTTRLKLSQAPMRRIAMLVPPLDEQGRIVEALESLLSRLDDAVASLERLQRNVKRYRASVLQAAVEGRLVPTEAELARAEGRDYEPASKLLERVLAERRRRWEEAERAKLRAKGKEPKGDAWKGKYIEDSCPECRLTSRVPDGWVIARLEQIADTASGGTPSRGVPEYFGGDIPWVKSGELRDGFVTASEETITTSGLEHSSAKWFPKGTICIALYGATVGKLGVLGMDAATNQAVCGIFVAAGISASYLYRALEAARAKLIEQGKGGAQPNISQEIVRAVEVPLPPRSEQDRIAAEVARQLSVAEELERTLEVQLTRCTRLRQSILKWAFEGKLVDQDPNDEPASVLLERIRAQKGSGGRPSRRPGRGRKAARPSDLRSGSS